MLAGILVLDYTQQQQQKTQKSFFLSKHFIFAKCYCYILLYIFLQESLQNELFKI